MRKFDSARVVAVVAGGFHPRLLDKPGRIWARRGHTDTKDPERGFVGEPEAGQQ